MLKKLTIILIVCFGSFSYVHVNFAGEVEDVLTSITEQMSDIKTVSVDFTQEKKMAVFSSAIILKGSLLWQKPDSFSWRVFTPIQYAIVIKDGVAKQWDGENNTLHEFKMSSNPVMRVASQQIQRWFSGQYQELSNEYDVTLSSKNPLSLACVPHKDSSEAGIISRVLIQFRGDLKYIDQITIEELSGDSTIIKFENIILNEIIPADAWSIKVVRPNV